MARPRVAIDLDAAGRGNVYVDERRIPGVCGVKIIADAGEATIVEVRILAGDVDAKCRS